MIFIERGPDFWCYLHVSTYFFFLHFYHDETYSRSKKASLCIFLYSWNLMSPYVLMTSCFSFLLFFFFLPCFISISFLILFIYLYFVSNLVPTLVWLVVDPMGSLNFASRALWSLWHRDKRITLLPWNCGPSLHPNTTYTITI